MGSVYDAFIHSIKPLHLGHTKHHMIVLIGAHYGSVRLSAIDIMRGKYEVGDSLEVRVVSADLEAVEVVVDLA